MTGRYLRASSSHVFTWARMSFTDQSPTTPGSRSLASGRLAYDSLKAVHAVSSLFRILSISVYLSNADWQRL